jgi:hypothetical protein
MELTISISDAVDEICYRYFINHRNGDNVAQNTALLMIFSPSARPRRGQPSVTKSQPTDKTAPEGLTLKLSQASWNRTS